MGHEFGIWQAFPSGDDAGMSYREWLIGQALQGFASTESARDTSFADMAHWAVQAADAVLEERGRELNAN